MLQVRKFCECCFMSETQVLTTVPDCSGCFPRNHFLEGGFTFQWGGGVFFSFQKKSWYWGHLPCPPPHYGKPSEVTS